MVHSSVRRSAIAAACLAFSSLGAWAQTVVITGSREPLAPERLAADVVVIDADTMRLSSADSLADLLRREAGVQLSRNGGPGQNSGMLLRGTASRQSVVLVDGVRVGSATLGYASLESLGLAAVQRVEVLRGPGSSLYGADALGGVVNIITQTGAGAPRFDGRLAVGGYGSREASAGLRGGDAAWDYAASVSGERSDGVSALRPGDRFGNHNPDRDGYRLDSAHLRLGFKPAPGQRIGLTLHRTALDSHYDASEFAPPDYAQDNSADFRTRLNTTVAALDWRGTLAPGLVGSVRAAHSEDDSRSGGRLLDRFGTRRTHLGAQLAWQTGAAGQLVAALESLEDRGRSTAYNAEVRRRGTAAVLELTGSAGALSWQADARRDHSSDYGGVSTARLGGSLALAPGLRLRALAGDSFAAPSFNDLYYPNYGVPSLRPERGRSVEAGLEWRGAAGEASATLWRNAVRDLIGYQSDPARCPADPSYAFGCAGNVSRARLQGLSVAGSQRLGALALNARLEWVDAEDADTGQRLPRRAATQAKLGADWTLADWTLSAQLLRLGARPDAGLTLPAETTLDLSALWRVAPAWTLQARLQNATDRSLQPARDYQGLGRQAWLVLRWEPRA